MSCTTRLRSGRKLMVKGKRGKYFDVYCAATTREKRGRRRSATSCDTWEIKISGMCLRVMTSVSFVSIFGKKEPELYSISLRS
jgi:hypothetical protein